MTGIAGSNHAALVTRQGAGRNVYVLGAEITLKIASAETGGAFTIFEGCTAPLEGPPLHRHLDQDEWWYILEGEFRFQVDGQELHAQPGDTVFAPRGSRHTFQNIGRFPGRTLTAVVPGGLDVFFEELEAAAPRGVIPDFGKLAPLFEKHRLEMLGPPLGAPADSGAAPAAGPDEEAICEIVNQLETAWNRHDSIASAAQFAVDATLIHIFGGELSGRAAIEASYRHIFDTIYKGSHARFRLRNIRFLRSDVAVVFLQARVTYAQGGEHRVLDSRPTLTVAKESGHWQITAFQNTSISELPAAAATLAGLSRSA